MRGFRPWTVQPPVGTGIDWDHPLARGLLCFFNPTTPGRDAATGYINSQSASGQKAVKVIAYRGTRIVAVYPGSSAGSTGLTYQQEASDSDAEGNFTALQILPQRGSNYWTYVNNQSSASATGFQFYSGGGTQWQFSIGDGTTQYQTGPITPPDAVNGLASAVWGQRIGSTVYTLSGTTSASVAASAVALPATAILNLGGGAGGGVVVPAGGIVALWDWALPLSARLSIERNPWQVFHRRRRVYSLITGSTISASISESVTSADSYALSATAAAAISEAATSADAYATSATIFATLTETIAPSDAYAIAVAVAAALDSSAAASSALTAVATIAATIAEVSTAQDTLGVTATVLAAIAEAATATDTQATGSVTSAAYADSATAAAIFNATVSIAATLTEAGLAADQIAAMATVAADLAESGAAADAYLSSVLLAVELLENAAAADELSATAFEQIIDAAKTIITIVQARDTVNIVQAQDTLRILQ